MKILQNCHGMYFLVQVNWITIYCRNLETNKEKMMIKLWPLLSVERADKILCMNLHLSPILYHKFSKWPLNVKLDSSFGKCCFHKIILSATYVPHFKIIYFTDSVMWKAKLTSTPPFSESFSMNIGNIHFYLTFLLSASTVKIVLIPFLDN